MQLIAQSVIRKPSPRMRSWLARRYGQRADAVWFEERPPRRLEAGLDQRTVVIEFDSVASAISAYESPAYQAARKLLGDTVERDIRIIEG